MDMLLHLARSLLHLVDGNCLKYWEHECEVSNALCFSFLTIIEERHLYKIIFLC